jgi:Flp pilus assembly protein TadG
VGTETAVPVSAASDLPVRRPGRQRGQALVLFIVVLVVIMGAASLVLDVGTLRNANQTLWNALDAGTLAGASQLPGDATTAQALAIKFANANYTGLNASSSNVSFRCVIGIVGGSPATTRDVPLVCNPGVSPTWTCNSTICVATCVPSSSVTCNTIVMTGQTTVGYGFGRVLGINSGQTQTVTSAACKGPCGQPPNGPVDVVLIMDRSSSMSGVDTANAQTAANSIRTLYNPAYQWLALGLLGPSLTGQSCAAAPDTSIGTAVAPGDLRRWDPVGLSGTTAPVNEDYTLGTSKIAKAITCLTNSSTGTDLADPIRMATYELINNGRNGVRKGIILETDGQPNASTTTVVNSNYCAQVDAAATTAKNSGIEIYTIGFGIDGANNAVCPDLSGTFKTRKASDLLASAASQPSADHGCPGSSNSDGDHYYCLPKTAGASTNLADVFKAVASSLQGASRLMQLP